MTDVIEQRQTHWQTVYRSKGEQNVSWFEESPAISLDVVRATGNVQHFQFSHFRHIG